MKYITLIPGTTLRAIPQNENYYTKHVAFIKKTLFNLMLLNYLIHETHINVLTLNIKIIRHM